MYIIVNEVIITITNPLVEEMVLTNRDRLEEMLLTLCATQELSKSVQCNMIEPTQPYHELQEKMVAFNTLSNARLDSVLALQSELSCQLAKLTLGSAKKGQITEALIVQELSDHFPDWTVSSTKATHCGDIIITTPLERIMVEVKNYSGTVPSDQIEKFYSDMDQYHYGIFVSNSRIAKQKNRIHIQELYNEGTVCGIAILIANSTTELLVSSVVLMYGLMRLIQSNPTLLKTNALNQLLEMVITSHDNLSQYLVRSTKQHKESIEHIKSCLDGISELKQVILDLLA